MFYQGLGILEISDTNQGGLSISIFLIFYFLDRLDTNFFQLVDWSYVYLVIKLMII